MCFLDLVSILLSAPTYMLFNITSYWHILVFGSSQYVHMVGLLYVVLWDQPCWFMFHICHLLNVLYIFCLISSLLMLLPSLPSVSLPCVVFGLSAVVVVFILSLMLSYCMFQIQFYEDMWGHVKIGMWWTFCEFCYM